MFFSLRLAALTLSALSISHVFGLAIPLVKRFVPYYRLMCWHSYCRFIHSRDQLCNGSAGLCDRKYGNTTFVGAHDSFAYSSNPFARKDIQLQLFRCGRYFLTIDSIQLRGLKRWMCLLS